MDGSIKWCGCAGLSLHGQGPHGRLEKSVCSSHYISAATLPELFRRTANPSCAAGSTNRCCGIPPLVALNVNALMTSMSGAMAMTSLRAHFVVLVVLAGVSPAVAPRPPQLLKMSLNSNSSVVRSRCLDSVRNMSYNYMDWNKHCQAAIGAGFECSRPQSANSNASAASFQADHKVPLFIKLHKVGGTTLGDVLQDASDRIARQHGFVSSRSCGPLLHNTKSISSGRAMSCDWCCGGHQAKNVYEVCGPLPFNSLCFPPEQQVRVA